MSFEYPYFLILILFLPLLWFFVAKNVDSLKKRFTPELYKKMVAGGSGMGRRARKAILLLSAAFMLAAMARPVIDLGEIKIKTEMKDLVVAFDISRSMLADDIYPNRLEMAKRKFHDLLDSLKDTRVAVVGFSSRAFLVAPLTADHDSLKYLVDHMGTGYVSTKGTDIGAPLQVAENLLKDRKRKALLIFTDGGDKKEFSKEISYAKEHGISVFIYAIGTKKGGVMRLEDGRVVRDSGGEVAITRLNPSIRELAEATGGVYMPYSLHSSDMRELASQIERRLGVSQTKERTIRNKRELFYYPLAAALLLFLVAFSSLPASLKRSGISGAKGASKW